MRRFLGRFVRRITVSLLLLGLVIAFYVLLTFPLRHPNTHIAVIAGADYQVLHAPWLEFAVLDADAFAPLDATLFQRDGGADLATFHHLATSREMASLGSDLARFNASQRDVVVFYIVAHGISQEGKPFVLCGDFLATETTSGIWPLHELLDQIKSCRAEAKLLILDAGRLAYEPRLGIVANEFPKLLQQSVHQAGDKSLWVLSANMPLEKSHVSHGLGRSVFGFFVTHGLGGAADLNQDRAIDVGELHRYVAAHVAAWVEQYSDGAATQTPQLLWGGGADIPSSGLPILSSVEPFLKEDNGGQQRLNVDTSQGLLVARDSRVAVEFPVPSASETLPTAGNDRTGGANASPSKVASPNSSSPASNTVTPDKPQGDTAAPGQTGNQNASDSEEQDKQSSERANRIAGHIVEGWDLCQRLRRSPEVELLNHQAPHLWREIEQSLLGYEQRLRGGGGNDNSLVAEVEQLLQVLRNLASHRELPHSGYEDTLHNRVSRILADMRFPEFDVRSLGLEESLAELGRPMPANVQNLLYAFDSILSLESRGPFDKWIDEEWKPEYHGYAELRLAKQLAALQGIDWPILKQALQTRRLAEKTAAIWHRSRHVENQILRADQLRQQGEHALQDQIRSGWQRQAAGWFAEASELYQAAADHSAQIQSATALCDDLLYHLPYYLRWRFVGGSGESPHQPSDGDLTRLLEALPRLRERIENGDTESIVDVKTLVQQLVVLRESIEAGLDERSVRPLTKLPPSPGNASRIDALLSTPLLGAMARVELLNAADNVDWAHAKRHHLPDGDSLTAPVRHYTPSDWASIVKQLEFEVALIQHLPQATAEMRSAAQALAASAETVFDAFDKFQHDPQSDERHHAMWSSFRISGHNLKEFNRRLPTWIDNAVHASADLSDARTRADRLMKLRAAARALALVDARDSRRIRNKIPKVFLRRAELYDLLVWQARRAKHARRAGMPSEVEYQTETAQRYRTAAISIPDQPPVQVVAGPELQIEATDSLRLTTDREGEIEVTLRSTSADVTDVWLTAHYDSERIEVHGDSDHRIYAQQGVPLDMGSVPPTVQLRAGIPRILRIFVRRVTPASRPTRLVLTAVTASDAARHDVEIPLPLEDAVQLSVSGTAGTWSASETGITLHPFSNRITPYTFALINGAGSEKTVDVELLVPANQAAQAVPRAGLPREDVDRLLRQFGRLNSIAALKGVKLPREAEPVLLPFPEPNDGGDGADSGNGNQAPGEPASADTTSMKAAIQYGLLLLMTDQTSGWTTVHTINVAPQRPRRFLQPRVGYDYQRGRILVSVAPQDASLLPPDGVKVRVNTVEPLPKNTQAVLEGDVKAPDFQANLYFHVPPSAGRLVTLSLDVDNFPRAFLYRVPCDNDSTNLPEWTDALDARITVPAAGTVYEPDNQTITVRVEVDAPLGAFDDQRSFVDLGIDRDRDRELRADSPVRIRSDRAVRVQLDHVAPKGVVALETTVDDLNVKLPVAGLRNVRAELLARLQVGNLTAWSEPVEVMFDAAGPTLKDIDVSPSRFLVIGEDLSVSVETIDPLSGVKQVEVALDIAGSGEISGENKPVAAAQQPTGGWLAKIPTADVQAGNYFLLVRASDVAGNASEYQRVQLTILTEEQAAERTAEMTTELAGTVIYGKQGQAGIDVTLSKEDGSKVAAVKTDGDGNYIIPRVPPGKFKLTAQGVVRNKLRNAETEIEIEPNGQPKPVELKLE